MTTLEAAIEYATKYKWKVFPVRPDKTPYTPHGCLDAKDDIGAIQSWWKKWPDALVGVATGSASNLIVIDEDKDFEKDLDGYYEVSRWESDHCHLPDTVRSITGRGGYHLFFHYTGSDIKNRAGVLDGVDVRGEGGYIIAPPSRHPNGRQYEWEIAPEDMKLADLDQTVLELIKTRETSDSHFVLPEKIATGERNDVIFKLACSLQAKGIPDAGIMAAVQAVNTENCIEPIDQSELKKIVTSATKYEKGDLAIIEPQKKSKKRKIRQLKTAEGLMQKDIPEPDVFVGVGSELPFLVEGTCILSAKPKLGKSWFALALCLAIANGEDFLGYKTQKRSVLYLDLETSESIQKKRLKKILRGKHVPSNFYIESETDTLDNGLLDQLEAYTQQDNNLGVIVIDVMQLIRSAAKNFKESEYEHAYRDITPLNEFAQKHHLSIVLVCHDRKAVDPDDPFSNILGSTGLQGAVSQMVVMFRKRKSDPIHISVKGKTIDGLIDLNVKLNNAEWSTCVGGDMDPEEAAEEDAYMMSEIRHAVIKIAKEHSGESWRGKSRDMIQDLVEMNHPISASAGDIGLFLNKHQMRFLKNDKVKVSIIKNGNGPKLYRICQTDIDDIDENDSTDIDEWENVSTMRVSELPFT